MCKMTRRLTCFFIFTLLTISIPFVFGQSSSDAPATVAPAAPATTATTGLPPTKCPSGDTVDDVGCNNCNDGGVCYRDQRQVTGGSEVAACCKKLNLACPSTGLFQKHSQGSKTGPISFLYYPIDKLSSDLWYTRNYTDANPAGVACPIPNSFTLVDRVVPKGWKEEGQAKSEKDDRSYELKKCTNNKECDDGEFCDAVFNPSFKDKQSLDRSGPNEKSLRFCFPLPDLEIQNMFDGQSMEHVDYDNGLKICGNHKECGKPEEFCHFTGRLYRNESATFSFNSTEPVYGICVRINACLKSDQGKGAVLNVNDQLCVADEACEGAGVSAGNQDYDPHCRSYWRNDTSRKGCCFEKNLDCRIGKAVTPNKPCKKFTDCTGEIPKNEWNTWCDDGGKNICCKDKENEAWQCPDLATPLFNEPKCTGSIKDKPNSGTCPKKGGICWHGHCCPGLRITENGTKIEIGKHLYRTEFPCDPNTAVANYFTYTFCNPEDKKLIVVGKFHLNGDTMTKVSGKKCTINADCSADASSVCVYENAATHICYFNPLRPLRPPVSGFWKTVLVISLVCGAIFLVLSLICFVCYRSKSVFDKYKKKKGKKGKKGSKSSKGSKSKKGKKGKKSKGSASSTNSKKKSKKETEKSETGASTGESSSQMN
uniref:DX domain-containing protein n=2 Tax=Caenorhabditis tropicalis TaxID=1561998 RepID=A0A1I7TA37_9PELO